MQIAELAYCVCLRANGPVFLFQCLLLESEGYTQFLADVVLSALNRLLLQNYAKRKFPLQTNELLEILAHVVYRTRAALSVIGARHGV